MMKRTLASVFLEDEYSSCTWNRTDFHTSMCLLDESFQGGKIKLSLSSWLSEVTLRVACDVQPKEGAVASYMDMLVCLIFVLPEH